MAKRLDCTRSHSVKLAMLDPLRSGLPVRKTPAVPRWKRSGHDVLDDTLQRLTLAWLKTLPEPARPHQCARQYPRVLNHIATLWNRPQHCLDYLDELLADRRGNRQGFSHAVALELRRLRARRAAALPVARTSPANDFPATEPMAP